MNKALLLLAVLALVGATGEQLLVHIDAEQASILATDTVRGQPPGAPGGTWSITLVDQEGTTLQETTFEPTIITTTGEQPLSNVWISIPKDARAVRLELYDDTSTRRDSKLLESACGDGVCQEHEQGLCNADCPFSDEAEETAIIQTTPLTTQNSFGWRAWGIGGAALLIVILILLLIHVNRKKDNPVQMETQYERL